MPSSIDHAIMFLETQWSSINKNKINGILAELRLKDFLTTNNVHFVPGGWIISPGNSSLATIPAAEKICILPRSHGFSWQPQSTLKIKSFTPAEISAYLYFRQVGIKAIFAQASNVDEQKFILPSASTKSKKANYPKPYLLDFFEISPTGLPKPIQLADALAKFPSRNGNIGLRCYKSDRISANDTDWGQTSDTQLTSTISELFWFEYSRYFINTTYLLSSNDLDLFIIGNSGRSYPAEVKSKVPAVSPSLGKWFGIDIGPFAKLSFFTSNTMNNDALYIVEEVSADRVHVDWYAIKFTKLVASCSWVGQAGGMSMTGGASSTFKIPLKAFTKLDKLLPLL